MKREIKADLKKHPLGTSWNDGSGNVWVVESETALFTYAADGKSSLSHLTAKALDEGDYRRGRFGIPAQVFVDWEVPEEPHLRSIWEDEIQYRLVEERLKDGVSSVVKSFRVDALSEVKALKELERGMEGATDCNFAPVSYHLLCDEPIIGKVSTQGKSKQFSLMTNGSVAVCGGLGSAQVWDYENQVEYQKDDGPCVLRLEWQDQQWARAVRFGWES